VFRRLASTFLVSRMGSARLVLASVALTTVVCAALTAAFTGFAGAALPESVHVLLTRPPAVMAISGQLDHAQVVTDAAAIRSRLRAALGTVPLRYQSALWSDPLGLAGSRLGGPTRLLAVEAAAGARQRLRLTRGRWPGRANAGKPVPALAPAVVAARMGLSVGTVITVHDTNTGVTASLRITGIVEPLNPAAPFWRLDIVDPTGASSEPGFVTYGPLIVDSGVFARRLLAVGGGSWVVLPQLGHISPGALTPLAGRLSRALTYLETSGPLHSLTVSTALPARLAGVSRDLVVARSQTTIVTLELLLLAASALLLAARLLAGQREEENALLAARGGGRWQLVRLAGAEAILLSAVASAAGVALAGPLAADLATAGPLRGAHLRITAMPLLVWPTGAAVFVLCAAILLWPVLRLGRPGRNPGGRSRRSPVSAAVSAGADLSVLVLAVLACWQLRRYSAVATTSTGRFGVDPVLVLAPVLALTGGTLLLIRVLPVLARLAEATIGRGSGLTPALVSWRLSRAPLRHSGPAVLVTLAVATAALAVGEHESWLRSVHDQAAFTAGADVRLDTVAPTSLPQAATIATARGIRAAMPAARVAAGTGVMLALESRQAPGTVLLRRDLAGQPVASLWRRIIPRGSPPGLVLPGQPQRLALLASLGPGSLGLASTPVTVTVQDAAGDTYRLPAGAIPADGLTHRLQAIVPRGPGGDIYPLRLIAITLDYADPHAVPARDAQFTVAGLAVSPARSGGFPLPFTGGGSLRRWVVSVLAAAVPAPVWDPPQAGGWQPGPAGSLSASFFPGYARERGVVPRIFGQLTMGVPAPATIPAIATRSYLSASHRRVGGVVPVVVGNSQFDVKLVADLAEFPTATGPGGALIVDQRTLQDVLATGGSAPVPVSEWWLRTASGLPPPGLPSGTVTTTSGVEAALAADPLSGGPQQALLALALAAGVLALVGLAVGVSAAVRERRSQSALLAALGVSRFAQARLLCLEQLALSCPAALAGAGLGALIALLVVPAVTLTPDAAQPHPPVIVTYGWPLLLVIAVAVALTPAVLAGFSAVRRPDPAAELRASESA
jgi:hypothetical protein